jgi:hypothetical protein
MGAIMATVGFWLNAFIPKTVFGYTVTIPTGPHLGKTAVPLPGIARTWPGNLFKDLNSGYLTDQRGFDNSVSASRRMQSWAEVELSTLIMTRQKHTSSGTTEVNLVTGVQTGFAVANMSRCLFTQRPSAPPFGGVGAIFGASHGGSTMPLLPPGLSPNRSGSATVQLKAAAGDPLVGMAADIDFGGTFTISVSGATRAVAVSFNGFIDAFPAYDCYATYNGVAKTLFTNSPPPGNTVANLLGGANRPVSGSATFF